MLRKATSPRRGVAPVARAIEMHAARPGSVFVSATGDQAAKNAAGEDLARGVLTNPGSVFAKSRKGRFGEVVDVIAPDGQELRFGDGGAFIGLREP